jgi:hypothetical protein
MTTKVQLVSNIVGNVSGGASFTGIVTASSFSGDGSLLTGIGGAGVSSTGILTCRGIANAEDIIESITLNDFYGGGTNYGMIGPITVSGAGTTVTVGAGVSYVII